MFKTRLADYINAGLHRLDMTYKEFSALSGVPSTTLHSYAQGRVNNPDEENLSRIARAFGDDPNVIREMRREAMEAAPAHGAGGQGEDAARMEQFVCLIRAEILDALESCRGQALAQQGETIAQAEQRCEARIKAADEIWRERLQTQKEHDAQILESEKQHRDELRERGEASRAYLKTLVRNLSMALALLICLVVGFGAYSVYAYTVFDRTDPSKGLYQGGTSSIPWLPILAAAAALSVVGYRIYTAIQQGAQLFAEAGGSGRNGGVKGR